jgi:hypothetical protein
LYRATRHSESKKRIRRDVNAAIGDNAKSRVLSFKKNSETFLIGSGENKFYTTVANGRAVYVNADNKIGGNANTALGQRAGGGVTTADNVICIGAPGANVSNSCYIGNIAGQVVGLGGSTCYVDNDGKLGVFLSSHRFKTDIADMATASEALLALAPSLSITSPSWIILVSRSLA